MSTVVECPSCGLKIFSAHAAPGDDISFDCPHCGTHPSATAPAQLGSGLSSKAERNKPEQPLGAETICHPESVLAKMAGAAETRPPGMGEGAVPPGTRILSPGERPGGMPKVNLTVQAFLLVDGASKGLDRIRLTLPKTVIGRQGADIQLPDAAITARHLEITAVDTDFVLRDLGSQNGTYVNGKQVQSVHLRDGDRIEIGQTKIVFRRLKVVPFDPY